MAISLLLATSASAQVIPDSDLDGVGDNLDNCVAVANANQRDTDQDGIGNACDQDLNDDCIVNAVDLGIFRSRFFSTDADADFNGDGQVNVVDLGALRQAFFSPPGPTGSQNLCSCVPPAAVPQSQPNFEFNGQQVFLTGSLAGNGDAVPGLNNFADQDNGLYLTRIFARSAGAFEYRIADQNATIDYCSDAPLALYAPLDLPASGCAVNGSVELPTTGCYEFALQTNGDVLPPTVALTARERLGRWDVQIDSGGGVITVPNGVSMTIPPGAVAAPTTLTIGDLPCAQVDALFDATTLNSHSNRCLGGFVGEPTGFEFDLPISVALPVTEHTADEIVLWVTATPDQQDYALVETVLNYQSNPPAVDTSIDQLAIFAAAGAVNINGQPLARGGPSLPSCCQITPTPLDCCCTTFNVTSTAGDAFNSDCDCELVGFDIEIVFPNCPDAPVFTDTESHSSAGCPTDLQPSLNLPDLTQWTCEQRTAGVTLNGTNQDGTNCNLSVPLTWSVSDPSIAQVQESALGLSATITGLAGGTTTLTAASNVGNQFSFSAPLSIVDLNGTWFATETGSQTCVIDSSTQTVEDMEESDVQVRVDNCNTVTIDVVIPGLDGTSGPFAASGDLEIPFDFDLNATDSANTLACFVFLATAGQDVDFGDPFCPPGTVCEPISCAETVTTHGTLGPAAFRSGGGFSQWSIDVAWTETVDEMTESKSASCTGSSTLTFER